jgi:Zn ribbon nucleic-acid-binding protein
MASIVAGESTVAKDSECVKCGHQVTEHDDFAKCNLCECSLEKA